MCQNKNSIHSSVDFKGNVCRATATEICKYKWNEMMSKQDYLHKRATVNDAGFLKIFFGVFQTKDHCLNLLTTTIN